ncbi:MAG: alpha-1,2-fucosyltransferase [Lachnospiraceae bacterium]|nr:alpha-1,2-fucosyltransferase [Lachnospiraceae bacterium]
MNIIRMSGGLGNQMFQYALYLKFALTGTDCRFDDFSEYEDHDNARPILLEKFGIAYPKASRSEVNAITNGQPDLLHRIQRKITGRRTKEYREYSCNYDEEVLLKDDAYLVGNFQTERYFRDIKEDVLEAFTFLPEVKEEAEEILRLEENRLMILPSLAYDAGKKNTVSIHIRRGDYLTTADVYGGICTPEYYRKAIEQILRSVRDAEFILFSDDKEWAAAMAKEWTEQYRRGKQNNRFSALLGTDEDTGYIDMYLMSLCRHHIIANSSFSWWGAYLDTRPGKMVFAPAKWSNTQKYRDIYTDDMILI